MHNLELYTKNAYDQFKFVQKYLFEEKKNNININKNRFIFK